MRDERNHMTEQNKSNLPTEQKVVTVAIIGIPNSGKSSLLNCLLDYEVSAVHRKPQMTRQNVLGILTEDSTQIVFIDTPGIHDSEQALNKILLSQVDTAIESADVILFLQEIQRPTEKLLIQFLARYSSKIPCYVVLTKVDLPQSEWIQEPKIVEHKDFRGELAVSALTKRGISNLKQFLKSIAQPSPFLYDADDMTTESIREICREHIRAHVMEHLHQEIPYEMAVVIDRFKELGNKTVLDVTLVVNKDSQKGLMIGHKGQTLAKIRKGSEAHLKTILQQPVKISLFVKVDKDWIKNQSKLKEYVPVK